MEPGYRLQNSEASLNFDVQALPTIGDIHVDKEEEEAAEDEKTKENELRDLLNGAFDDLIEDDDDEDYNSSCSKNDEEKEANLNSSQNNWPTGSSWYVGFDSSRSHMENIDDKNLVGGVQENQISYAESNVHSPSEAATDNYGSEYIFSGRGENPDPNASGDNSAPCSSTSWVPELGEQKDQISDRSYNSEIILTNGVHNDGNGMNSSPEKGGLNPNATPFSSYSQVKKHPEYQYYKELDTGGNYQVQYTRGCIQRNDWSNGMLNDMGCHLDKEDQITAKQQHQYINAGMDDNSPELTQMKILYAARGRELNKLQTEFYQEKENAKVKIVTLSEELELIKGENEDLINNVNKLQQSLNEVTDSNEKQQGTIEALEIRIKTQEESKMEILKKLKIAEATIETLNHQIAELESADVISRARTQHDIVICSMQQKHNDEMQTFREQNDKLQSQYQSKCEEASRMQHEFNQLVLSNEQMQLDRAETINRLTKSLEESQRQCENMLRSGKSKEKHQSHDSGLSSLSSVSEKIITSLQEEIATLKEELEMYENTCNIFGNTQNNDSLAQLNVKRTLNWKSPQSPKNNSSESAGNELMSSLKGELERCLSSNRNKRSKLTKLQADYRNNLRDLELLKSQLTGAEKQILTQQTKITSLQTKLNELQPLSKGGDMNRIHELERIRIEKEDLMDELEETQEKLAEVSASETQLNEAVRQLHQQMSQLVQENNDDRRQALERCQQTYLQLHEDSIKKIRKEMNQLHSEEMKKVQQELQLCQKEVDSVKEMYVTVCQEKNDVETKLEDMIRKCAELERRCDEIKTNLKMKIRELQYQCDQRSEQALSDAELQKTMQQNLDALHAEKDKETIQKIMDVTHRLEMEKELAIKETEEKKNKEILIEMKKLNEKVTKEHQEALKSLKQKMLQEKEKFVEVLENGWKQNKLIEINDLQEKHEIELQRVTEKLTQERLLELKKLDEKRDKERKKLIQHIVLKKNKEKHEKIKQLEEERKEKLSRMIAIKNDEINLLEKRKNEEIESLNKQLKIIDMEYEEKIKFLVALIKDEFESPNKLMEDVKNVDNLREFEELVEWKVKTNRELKNELKILADQKDREHKSAVLKLAAKYDEEINALKEDRTKLINKLRITEQQLNQKNDEIEEMKFDFEKQLQGEMEDIQAKLSSQKEQEKLEALRLLSSRKRKETQEAILTLAVKKELQHEEAMKQLEKKLEKEKDEALKVMAKDKDSVISCCEHRLDLDCLRSLQEQNNELLKLYKNAKEEYEKEKTEIQLQHTNSMTLLKEKHLQLVKSLQREQQASRHCTDCQEDKQQIATLLSQVGKLESDLKLHQAKIRELETIVTIKNGQLESLQQEQNIGMKHVEVQVQTVLGDLQAKLREKESELQRLKLDHDKEMREVQMKLFARLNENSSVDSGAQKVIKELAAQTQKKEESLLAEIHRLECDLQEKKMQIQLSTIKSKEEIEKLKRELENALKERDTTLESLKVENKDQANILQLAEKEKAQLKVKLHQCQKLAQTREIQHQGAITKLQQDHTTLVKELSYQLEEMKKSSVVRAESRLHEMSQLHLAQVTALKEQYAAELSAIQKQYSTELETVKGLVQHYQAMYKQLQLDCDSENAIEIQDSIKQVVKALQRDLFQYLNGLNKRVAQRIHKEVMRERRTIIARLREQFDAKDLKGIELSVLHASSSQVETQFESPSLSGNLENGKRLMNLSTGKTWTGLTQTKSGGFLSGNTEYKCTSSKMALDSIEPTTADKLTRLLHNFTLHNNDGERRKASRKHKGNREEDQEVKISPEKNTDSITPLRPAFSFDQIPNSSLHNEENNLTHINGSDGALQSSLSTVTREQPIGQSASEIVVSKSCNKSCLGNKSKKNSPRSYVDNVVDSAHLVAKPEGTDLEALLNELELAGKSKKTKSDNGIQQVIESNPEIINALLHSFQNNLQRQTQFKRIYELRNAFNETQLKVSDTVTSKSFVPLETESDSSNGNDKINNNSNVVDAKGEINWGKTLDPNSGRQWVRKHIDQLKND